MYPQCPVPPEQRRPIGIDPEKGANISLFKRGERREETANSRRYLLNGAAELVAGVGTAYEGLLKTPRPDGVKKVR